ncbi:isopentenyl-diphosphate Delta-isomerase [Nocardioides perillae]|uniref:Isopentenyl-diphosphate Delta-isomerase n=1 Tax=Nocardioides perillae TaxID=1119534 RepID=A0A7Y9URU2_9ACTN|nr:isopentenyl-diphosphate delta-isomerase [Nocardioides perillae]
MPTTDTRAPAEAADEVVLVDESGAPQGTAPRLAVHTADTPLHLAFSLHVLDRAGRTLLTRRALAKRTWPGVWTNSCCGHPRPGEATTDAVRRRVGEELGLRVDEVTTVLPDFRYRAVDASGVVEHELCPVHVAVVDADAPLRPDPAEVAEHTWVAWGDLHTAVTATPAVFSPWMVLQVRELGPHLPTGAPSPGDATTRAAHDPAPGTQHVRSTR